jgi:hypothetical protein
MGRFPLCSAHSRVGFHPPRASPPARLLLLRSPTRGPARPVTCPRAHVPTSSSLTVGPVRQRLSPSQVRLNLNRRGELLYRKRTPNFWAIRSGSAGLRGWSRLSLRSVYKKLLSPYHGNPSTLWNLWALGESGDERAQWGDSGRHHEHARTPSPDADTSPWGVSGVHYTWTT